MWSLGRNHFEIPVAHSYVPVRHNIMPKPDVNDFRGNQLGFRWSNPDGDRVREPATRLDYTSQLSPLKGYKSGVPLSKLKIPSLDERKVKWQKRRRLAQIKNLRNFSTAIERPEMQMGEEGLYAKMRSILPCNILTSYAWQRQLDLHKK